MKTGFGYVIGRRHAAEPDPELQICQDLAETYTDEEVSIIAVADGKAGKNSPEAAVAAARINVDTIIAFFRDPATWRIAEKNDFKRTALQMLDSSIETVAGGGEFRYEELRATVSAVAVRANGEFLAISIGDGTVVAYDHNLKPSVLIAPYRDSSRKRTVYTNDPDGADAHMSAWGGTLTQSDFLAFAVFTDGADYLTRRDTDGLNILRTAAACTLFGSGDEYIKEAISEISAEHTRDDVSLAVLTEENEQAFAAAKAVLLEAKAAKEAANAAAEAQEILADSTENDDTAEETAPVAEAEQPAEESHEIPQEAGEEAEELPNPPMPAQPPVSADPTPAELVVLRAVYAKPMTAAELVAEGHVRYGRILESTLPLIRAGKIRYENGKFAANE
ncbi:MAG: protein phosphatase 2C domain-containing protein [Oscillospiraceae bacterium]|nr:protein phosphatase 2C domain-containing protein [Oscillospiraceae bacterium]